jgi:hypothetical protein
MNLAEQYQLLVNRFNFLEKQIRIDDLSTSIIHFSFESSFPGRGYHPDKSDHVFSFDPELVKSNIPENDRFSYPVVVSGKNWKSGEVILLLHGLNERTWNKYLIWAKYLAEHTGQPVILFPLAFHMNRSPEKWNDAHAMAAVSSYRKSLFTELNDSTYLNAALSTRIENFPEQFFVSGMQSYLDIVRFVSEIKAGRHPLFRRATEVNIFSYSIGAFLSELLVMANPEGLFDRTKLCLFCGGATFDEMNAASRYIMDSHAFEKLHSFSERRNFRKLKNCVGTYGMKELKHIWKSMRLMTFLKEGRTARERILKNMGQQVYAIGLEKDKVVPAAAILQTLKGQHFNLPTKVEIMDFPYNYTHEAPFPFNDKRILPDVDRCFNEVFAKVAGFLA